MLIENPDMLKIWLTSNLEPLCDADPAALAKYVMALVKKDKSESDLKDVCLDQLDVFLQKETKPFVTMLFDALKSKAYIKSTTSNSSVKSADSRNNLTNPVLETPENAVATPQVTQPVVPSSQKNSLKDDGKTSDGALASDRERLIRGRKSRSSSPHGRSRSRSRSRSHSPAPHDRRSRSKDERRIRGRYDDERRRNRFRRNENRGYGDSWKERDKEGRNRERNRSLSRSRSRSKSLSPRPKEKRTDGDSGSHRDVDYRVPPISKRGDHSVQNNVNNMGKPRVNKRCQDYDEKGFCMRGDLCPYDHGTDPVVVEDANLPNLLGFRPTGPVMNLTTPTSASSNPSTAVHPPRQILSSMPNIPPPSRPLMDSVRPPPPPPPPRNEGYNPEAPGIERPLRMRTPFWSDSAPPPIMPNAVTNIRNARPRGSAPFIAPVQQPQRTLIGIPVVEDLKEEAKPKVVTSKPVINSQVTVPGQSELNENSESATMKHQQPSNFNKRNNFPFNRLGKRKFNQNNDNCILELRKIPSGLNTITQLNNHFGKFGNIVNLQICYEGDPEAALITFSSNTEAHAAYRSTEPILNNRFIKVFWHNKENNPKPAETKEVIAKSSVKDRLGSNKVAHANSTNSDSNTVASSPEKAVVFSGGGNLARTVFNSSALKKSNVNAQANSSVENTKKKAEEQRKETLKKKVDLQKRKQELLEKQIQQQKLLIEKIEKNKNMPAEDKEAIMKTIKQLSKSIVSTKKQINKNEMQKLVANSSGKKTKQDTQKEILDAELELYNKQHSGVDTSELRRKVSELKSEATSLGLIGRGGIAHRGSRPRAKGRGAMQWANHSINKTNIDHRPKKLKVRSPDGNSIDKIEIINHFAKFVEVQDCIEADNGVIVSFKTRKDAESAATYGTKFKDRMLILSWYKDPIVKSASRKPSESALMLENEEEDLENQDDELIEDAEDLLLVDDEEEEDSEARSWRR